MSAEADIAFPRRHESNKIKILLVGMGYLLVSCSSRRQTQAIASILGSLLELGSKMLLLKTQHTLVSVHKEIWR